MTPTAWLMTAGDDGSSDWCEVGTSEPERMSQYVAVPLYTQADIDAAVMADRARCIAACRAVALKMRASYKRSPNQYMEGLCDGVDECLDAIQGLV